MSQHELAWAAHRARGAPLDATTRFHAPTLKNFRNAEAISEIADLPREYPNEVGVRGCTVALRGEHQVRPAVFPRTRRGLDLRLRVPGRARQTRFAAAMEYFFHARSA